MIVARAVVLLAALGATACGARVMKLPTGPGLPAADASEILQRATAACSKVTSMSAELAVRGSVHGNRVRGRLLVGVAQPDSAYIEAPAPFGAPVFVLGVVSGEATLLLPRDRRVVQRAEPRDLLEATTGVPVGPSELGAVLTGCPTSPVPASVDARSVGENWRVIGGQPTLYLTRSRPSEPWRLVSVVRSGVPSASQQGAR
jgi:hypothetical protein